jgi:hypothetical protein
MPRPIQPYRLVDLPTFLREIEPTEAVWLSLSFSTK